MASGRLLAVVAAAVAACLTGCAVQASAGTGAPRSRVPGRKASIARKTAVRKNAAVARGGINPRLRTCLGQGPVIGEIGRLAATSSEVGKISSGIHVLSRIRTARNTLVLFRPEAAGGDAGAVAAPGFAAPGFAAQGAVRAQSSIPALHSCDMLLSDRPAARRVELAAEKAAVSAGLSSSVARLRSALQEALISDDPIGPGSVIVTLLLPGAAYGTGVPGAPELHRLAPVTVVLTYPGLKVEGAARGGF